MQQIITGIQQVGIGVVNADDAKMLYKDLFGMNVLIFDDVADASLMTQYTGKKIHQRRALLTMNMNGGGGFEIWQFTSRKPAIPLEKVAFGDIGIFAIKIKSPNVAAAHKHLKKSNFLQVSPLCNTAKGKHHFWLIDKEGNHFNIVEGEDWFKKPTGFCGGVVGAVIGVSNMDKALPFYTKLLGIDKVEYDETEKVNDLFNEHGESKTFRRVLLKKQVVASGAFSKLLGGVSIELVEAKDGVGKKIYANRYWGDCGFIHLCFDVLNMDALKTKATHAGYTFTVDSANSFAMGQSAGRFCYVEDPDGTLIELVETHKVPILKKAGLYFNLQKRKSHKPLPTWMINLLALNKIK